MDRGHRYGITGQNLVKLSHDLWDIYTHYKEKKMPSIDEVINSDNNDTTNTSRQEWFDKHGLPP